MSLSQIPELLGTLYEIYMCAKLLRCAVLCCAVSCCAVLRCAVLSHMDFFSTCAEILGYEVIQSANKAPERADKADGY